MIHIYALTGQGKELAIKVKERLGEGQIYVLPRHKDEGLNVIEDSLKVTVTAQWKKEDIFIMIMATGIVIRTIKDLIKHKTVDPAVLVIDQSGQYIIPLLSGHLGGANDMALKVGQLIGAEPVVTTATDVQGVLSFDMIAKKSSCAIENIHHLKDVSGILLDGNKVKCYATVPLSSAIINSIELVKQDEGQPALAITEEVLHNQNQILVLRPKNLIVGIGCRRGTKVEVIRAAIEDLFNKQGLSINAIKQLVSVNIKEDEEGIIAYAKERQVPFITYTIEELKPIIMEHHIEKSAFVTEQIGIGAVSEPAAIKGAKDPVILTKKTVCQGITLTIVKDQSVMVH